MTEGLDNGLARAHSERTRTLNGVFGELLAAFPLKASLCGRGRSNCGGGLCCCWCWVGWGWISCGGIGVRLGGGGRCCAPADPGVALLLMLLYVPPVTGAPRTAETVVVGVDAAPLTGYSTGSLKSLKISMAKTTVPFMVRSGCHSHFQSFGHLTLNVCLVDIQST